MLTQTVIQVSINSRPLSQTIGDGDSGRAEALVPVAPAERSCHLEQCPTQHHRGRLAKLTMTYNLGN
jgi:hypothetical protein